MEESTWNAAGRMRLLLQGDQLTFLVPAEGDAATGVSGSLAGTRRALARGKLSAPHLEDAIAEVEDLIMPLLRALPARTALEAHGPELAEVFHLLGACDGAVVPLAAVESLFDQLVAVTSGSPVAWRHAVPPATVAPGLLLLREVMQHGGFRSVFWLLQME